MEHPWIELGKYTAIIIIVSEKLAHPNQVISLHWFQTAIQFYALICAFPSAGYSAMLKLLKMNQDNLDCKELNFR